MAENTTNTNDIDWQTLLPVLQLIAERGRRIRLEKKETTVDDAPLAGDTSTAVDQLPAQSADTF